MCEHEDFHANVVVSRLANGAQRDVYAFAAEVRVECADCGAQFGFRVPRTGMAADDAYVSPDAKELRVYLLTPSEIELVGGLAGMNPLPPLDTPGFRVEHG